MTSATLLYDSAWEAGLRPTEDLTVSDWADAYRQLSADAGAKEKGQWHTSRFPFLREIMDNLGPFSGVQETIIMGGAKTAKTEVGMNFLGYCIHLDPSNFLIVVPSLDLARRRAKTKIQPTIDATPVLAERVRPARERDSLNTTLSKAYPGGTLVIAGANSAASLSDLTAKYLHLDEVDRYQMDLEQEGDTIYLAKNRTDEFEYEKRILITSTPTIKGFSKIHNEFLNSDQRYLYVPCPLCGHMQYLRWKDGKWNGDGEYRFVFDHDEHHQLRGPVLYRCESCGEAFGEHHKTWMLEHHEWRPHNPGHPRRGYFLPSLYSPLGFLSWAGIVQQYLDAKRERDFEKLKTWKNTRLGEPWDEEDDPSLEDGQNLLLARRENYGPQVPMGGLVLVAGVDVQHDRLEANIAAFGYGEEWWNLDYRIIPGTLAQEKTRQDLDDFLFAPWLHESGAMMRVTRVLVDSGDGTAQQEIYDYVRPRQRRGVFASRGSQFARKPIIERSKKRQQGGIRLHLIGTDTAKDSFFARIAIKKAGQEEAALFQPLTPETVKLNPMYVHWNMNYDEEFFMQLFAEVAMKEKKGRQYKRFYKQVRARNEALDIEVLCLAAVRLAKPSWKMLIKRLAENAKKAAEEKPAEEKPPVAPAEPAPEKPALEPEAPRERPLMKNRPRPRPRGGWVNAWR